MITRIETKGYRLFDGFAADPSADTSALEREIDQQVYQLYGLTPEEIAIVEGATPGKGTESK